MANYRIKASGIHSEALDSIVDKVYSIASVKDNKDVLVLASQIDIAKNDERIERIFGKVMFDLLVKRRQNSVGVADVNFEVEPYDYLKNHPDWAYGRTVVVLNPSLNDLDNLFQNNSADLDLIVIEMQIDGELDSWVQANKALDI
ncbi:hypothetical protein ACE2I8_003506 [Salmonella enterica]|nr:hypothetical protein [Salmonella enterica subsp. enterica serovar Stanley]ECZ6519869.1 hypothetical protein [Salmonella enterica]HCK6840213.1 hypothetical protein [Salmonella enterica subsp. enterica serovar Typhi str. CT18]EAA6954804.1 hypothetical protein [Salmonella enterica subsp. enterica serovar Stanley]EAB8650316.1 hypothetical protein [Salmonella enterica subsp. enterica serovar Stanley]